MDYFHDTYLNLEERIFMRDIDLENKGLPQFCKHEYSDQHYPFNQYVKRGAFLKQTNPRELKIISGKAKDKSNDYMQIILQVSGSQAQYALLKHYHTIAGTIPHTQPAKPMTINEQVAAYNLFQSGTSMQEIANELNRGISTIWRLLTGGKPKKEYNHISQRVRKIIIELYEKGVMVSSIAERLNIPYRAVRAQIYERKGRGNYGRDSRNNFYSREL